MFIHAVDGTDLHVTDVGRGRPVVLIAGFGLDHRLWDRQIRVLAAADLRVVTLDQRGHGRSDNPLGGYDVHGLATDLVGVLTELDLDDVTLVGHSFGGQVAFAATVITERVSGLVLVGSNGVRASRAEHFPFGAPAPAVLPGLVQAECDNRIRSRRSTLTAAFATPPDEDTVRWLLDISLQLPSWAAVACYRSMLESDTTDLVGSIDVPVLQVLGADDPVHSARGARWLGARLRRSQLVEIPACGHYPMLEQPAAFDAALLAFCDVTASAAGR